MSSSPAVERRRHLRFRRRPTAFVRVQRDNESRTITQQCAHPSLWIDWNQVNVQFCLNAHNAVVVRCINGNMHTQTHTHIIHGGPLNLERPPF